MIISHLELGKPIEKYIKEVAKVRVRRGILGKSLIFHKPETPYL